MNEHKSSAGKGGMGFLGVLQIVFIVLKLCKLIKWSWPAVLIPLWIEIAWIVLVLLLVLIVSIAKANRMSTFERMLRYAKYGYFPCKETKMKIINALRDLTDEQVELSESLYDGMD